MSSVLALLALLTVQSAEIPNFVVPSVLDLTIKTRRTVDRPDSSVETKILYLKGARQRRETIVDWPPKITAINGKKRTRVGISITQCDEQRTLSLNDQAKTYAYSAIQDPSEELTRVRRLAANRVPQPAAMITGGDVLITHDAVDTGERWQVGRYTARHVITTTKTEPGPGASVPASVDERDGWYIDLPPADCRDWGDRPEPFSITYVQPGGTHDGVHIKRLGAARAGFAIEETTRTTNRIRTTDIDTVTTKLELIEISDKALDASLFRVPDGYRPALPRLYGGHDMTKPDTLTNRVESYWQELMAWADHLFR